MAQEEQQCSLSVHYVTEQNLVAVRIHQKHRVKCALQIFLDIRSNIFLLVAFRISRIDVMG